MASFSELLGTKKNFIFIGETGSGKSEIALNTAVMLRREGSRSVHLFDLDQTKAMFRARDAREEMDALGVSVHYMPQLLDTPVMVNGIIPHLVRRDSAAILDVGGNENAARMIGCLSDYLNGENTAALYVLNPYRPWSGTLEDIRETMGAVLSACRIEKVYFLGNPTVGQNTGREDFEAGMEVLLAHIDISHLSGVFAPEDIISSVKKLDGLEYHPLHRYLIYPW